MSLDRKLQLEILQELSEAYPNQVDLSQKEKHGTDEYDKLLANVYYLQSHKLITDKSVLTSGTLMYDVHQLNVSAITHHGMDFLADDGGLTAILGTVTIKFDEGQLKTLLESKILNSDLTPEHKKSLIDGIKELPSESIKHLTMKIVDMGWDSLGSLMKLIENSLQ